MKSKYDASEALGQLGFYDRDFFTLSAEEVGRLVEEADRWGYRKPMTANGSRARYFYAYLVRLHKKERTE
jgi:hypothetical protein